MVFNSPNQAQVMALAGLFQCCALVDQLAKTGSIPDEQLEACLESLFIDSLNPYDVLGSSTALSGGIQTMQNMLTIENTAPQANTVRYAVGAVKLAGKLRGSSAMLHDIGERLEKTQRMRAHFTITHENIITNLAEIYVDTIGSFPYRIQVNGFQANLEQKVVAAKIRCLLFAAIRFAILWHRNGGRKRHLVFNRKLMLRLLKELPA